jgi:hypothetical protein
MAKRLKGFARGWGPPNQISHRAPKRLEVALSADEGDCGGLISDLPNEERETNFTHQSEFYLNYIFNNNSALQ